MIEQKCFTYFILPFLLLFPHQALAFPRYGLNFSYALISKEPPNLHGAQLMMNYDPEWFMWKNLNIFFDGGISYFKKPDASQHASITIFSAAPVFRFQFRRESPLSPFVDLSIGFSYLNRTRIEKRNLGIHFAFQDRIGIGTLFGESKHLSIGIHAVHYSNGRLSAHNSGITVPLVLDVGYRF